MLTKRLLDKLNQAAKNPEVLQVVVYNLKTKEGLRFNRNINQLGCLCGFCIASDLIITQSHINLLTIPNGFIQNYPSHQSRSDNPGRKPTETHGADNAQSRPTDSGNPVG